MVYLKPNRKCAISEITHPVYTGHGFAFTIWYQVLYNIGRNHTPIKRNLLKAMEQTNNLLSFLNSASKDFSNSSR